MNAVDCFGGLSQLRNLVIILDHKQTRQCVLRKTGLEWVSLQSQHVIPVSVLPRPTIGGVALSAGDAMSL